MTEPGPTPPGLPDRGAAPVFTPSDAVAASVVRAGRQRRARRGLVVALAAVVLSVAVVAITPGGGSDESLRVAQTPASAPAAATPSPDDPTPAPSRTAQPAPQPSGPDPAGEPSAQAAASPGPERTATPSAGGPAPGPDPDPGSRAGVDDDAKTLTVLLQVPSSAGVREGSAARGAAAYWQPGGRPRTVKGYRVLVETVQASGSGAGSACGRRAGDGLVVVGASTPSDAQACAGAPGLRDRVPYLAPGSVEEGLRGLTNHVALSLTYRGRAGRLVEMADAGGYLETRNGWALVLQNTPEATEAAPAVVAALEGAGQEVTVIRVPRSGADSTAVAAQLREAGYESVYFHGSPLFFVELAGKVGCPAYCPRWTGVGVSTDDVGRQACSVTGRSYEGEFLSSHPGRDLAAERAPGLDDADEAALSAYGSMQLLDQVLQQVPGPSFTRESFLETVTGGSFAGGVFPRADFATSRFGGTAAYAVRMDCAKQEHVTTGLH